MNHVKGWIFQANQIYTMYRTPEEEKSQIASMYLKDDALLWLYSYMEDKQFWPSWRDFCINLCHRFDPSAKQDASSRVEECGSIRISIRISEGV